MRDSQPLREQLIEAMSAFERCQAPVLDADLHWAALAGLGSKYLAVGSPDSLALVHCGSATPLLALCHEILFGPLQMKYAGDAGLPAGAKLCSPEEAFASDIVCMPWGHELEPSWIAEATHLNLLSGAEPPSGGSLALFANTQVTVHGAPQLTFPERHGSLDEVITGRVSGRIGDELTILVLERGPETERS